MWFGAHREPLPFPPVVISIDNHAEMMTVAVDLDDMPAERRDALVHDLHEAAGQRGLGIRFVGRWEL